MITLSLHLPSIIVGLILGYALIATVFLSMSWKASDFHDGWEAGCKYGRDTEREKLEKEKKNEQAI